MKDFSIYTGIVIQNNDPDKAGRVKIYVPGVTNTVYDNWNNTEPVENKEFSFIDGSILPIIEQLKEDLPWAVCASGLFGGDSSQILKGTAPTATDRPAGLYSIPNVGSHVTIFFKLGNTNYPIYFASSHGADEWATAIGEDYPTDGTDTNAHVFNTTKHGFKFVDTKGREEILLEHSSGSKIQMLLDDVTVRTVTDKTETVGADYTITVGNTITINAGSSVIKIGADGTMTVITDSSVEVTTPETTINGNLTVTGNITGQGEVSDATGTITTLRGQYNAHSGHFDTQNIPAVPQMT